MKKVIRLTERDLTRLVKSVIEEDKNLNPPKGRVCEDKIKINKEYLFKDNDSGQTRKIIFTEKSKHYPHVFYCLVDGETKVEPAFQETLINTINGIKSEWCMFTFFDRENLNYRKKGYIFEK